MVSNKEVVLEKLQKDQKSDTLILQDKNALGTKTLGIGWDRRNDEFFFEGKVPDNLKVNKANFS